MTLEAYLQQWIEEAPALVASIVAVLFMVGVAALLGFRRTARLDEAALQRLAAAEGAEIEHAVIGADGRAGLARLAGDKLMIARVMGGDVSARIVPAGAAKLQFAAGRLSVRFGDIGYPSLHLALEQAPPWLELAAGERS